MSNLSYWLSKTGKTDTWDEVRKPRKHPTWKQMPWMWRIFCQWCPCTISFEVCTLGWPKKQKNLIFSKNMKYVSYMIYLRPMIILESLKYPPGLCTINFNFTKGFAPKYKGNICILVFWRFSNILFLRNDSKSVRSFCLIDTLLLIPILP